MLFRSKKEGGCTVKYVELAGRSLVLLPHNQAYPVDVIALVEGAAYYDYLVGRVCHVAIET